MNQLGIPVFDMHAHLPAPGLKWGAWEERFVRRYGADKLAIWLERNTVSQRRMWERYKFPDPQIPQPEPEECARLYAEEVERYGLSGICFLTGGGNERLAQALRPYPRLFGFAHHDPFATDAPDALFRAVRELGLKGYKVMAPLLAGELSDPRLDSVWQACAQLGIPVLVHFGPVGGGSGVAAGVNISPLSLHEVAKGWPNTPFIVPHFGTGYLRELLHLMWACDNVCVDTSGSNQWRWYLWPQPELADLFKLFYSLFGPSRLLFGTDSSYFPRGWVWQYAKEQLQAAAEAGIPDRDIEQIFLRNAISLLGLEHLAI
jgi:predicted TIM-barrel fold metal-dependent hydrolase